ncbi:hydrolase [Mycobacterium leprae Kyoto-2]|uniref:Possible hydrolase n=3 Tax=Mycobacterium leprae TaxID=1769 RepID=Q9CBT2_MYCLE|nr:alpha/beta hydrolase [Mycobacterium leprae]CAR71727.1 possible hydrolase [Mycobacterium leprae Br4923]AWV48142.1 alpha/beta hydrolase [Mycobacterium leprae]OAR20968.1 hydrolase [Mycobacterium leprae 3125609]OAX71131.1 hydrolase [Mycobacterium leprae 7935681]CAC30583.1 possible hydrolase [Mycobacterium leprae]
MVAMPSLRSLSSALLSLGLLLQPAMTPPVVGASPEQTPSPVPEQNWGNCSVFLSDTSDIPSARCATVSVPVDYNNPDGVHAELAVIRAPATGQRIGSLLFNPGGPGASAVDMVAEMIPGLQRTDIGRHFDLVGFDPRGVGHSTPALRCRTDVEFDAYRTEPMVDYSPAGVAHIEQVYKQLAQQCVARVGTAFLANVGTASAARDMDIVRLALGDEQINYLGYSYGTELGTAYLERFSDHVRAMVLDGAIDPSVSSIQKDIQQMAGFQIAFTDYAADCARSASCPLGTDPSQWVNRYHALIDPLVTKPGRTSDPRGLGYADATTGTINALYTPVHWKYLTSGLLGLQRGTDAGDLLLLADDYNGRDRNGHYTNDQDAFNAIRCVDAPVPTDSASWVSADQQIRQAAPFLNYGQFTGNAPRDICALWPVPATSMPHPAPPVAPGKVVVVSTTHDPATPYQAGVDLARELSSPLITYDGTQHTAVFNGDQCVDSAVVHYFVDETLLPASLQCQP